jgi:hypothetical protein
MKRIILFVFTIFQVTLHASSFSIETTYKKNSNIWGAYSLTKESLKYGNIKKILPANVGHLIITGGRINIARDKSNSHNSSSLQSLNLNHIQTKATTTTFTNKSKLHNNDWLTFYGRELKTVSPHKAQLVFNHYKCKRINHQKIKCSLAGKIIESKETFTLNDSLQRQPLQIPLP